MNYTELTVLNNHIRRFPCEVQDSVDDCARRWKDEIKDKPYLILKMFKELPEYDEIAFRQAIEEVKDTPVDECEHFIDAICDRAAQLKAAREIEYRNYNEA